MDLDKFLTLEWAAVAGPYLRGVLVALIGWVVARMVSAAVERLVGARFSRQAAMVAGRFVFYGSLSLVVGLALVQMGFDLSLLMAAGGAATVAIGFASQTSASNVISGLFLVGEQPFVVGDIILVGQFRGEVVSVDLLSVKLRTYDNLLVRVPNETLLKTEITNLTHFPIRRFDLQVGVAYDTDMRRAVEVLLEVADANPRCLDEPTAVVHQLGFGDSAILMQLSAWTLREHFIPFKSELAIEVKEAFDKAGIEIPFPQRTLTARGPLPVRMVPPETP